MRHVREVVVKFYDALAFVSVYFLTSLAGGALEPLSLLRKDTATLHLWPNAKVTDRRRLSRELLSWADYS